jgi:predicted Zn-dependent protease
MQYELALGRVAGPDLAGLVGVAYHALSAGYSHQQETDADQNGVLIAAAAGYDPEAAVDCLRRLNSTVPNYSTGAQSTLAGETLQAIVASVADYGQTHPPNSQRVADVEMLIRSNAARWTGSRFYVGMSNYEDRQSRFVSERPNEWRVFRPLL